MGYFITYENKFIGDRHKLNESPTWAKYVHHPSAVRKIVYSMRNKGLIGEYKVFRWKSKIEVTEEVLTHES